MRLKLVLQLASHAILLKSECELIFENSYIEETIQLEYTDAKESLLQAARKASVAARGFRILCNKWAVIVRRLLDEMPKRTIFMQKGIDNGSQPYFEHTNISLVDFAKILRLDSTSVITDEESMEAKAICDSAIDANGWMLLKETGDVYSSNEPQTAFNTQNFLLPQHAHLSRESPEAPAELAQRKEKCREEEGDAAAGAGTS
ncbi:hypothetical protein Nepgr_029185 [Nepenthes gracilis]|uniref:26S proteasome non-ATPase regulatory subunit 3 N-terminal TPR repeats domain-containing protein n=1 Tax=Nepenthes gracilis TaxID=150966 RepID=A0AAD3Y2S3_NEPGR|nr:hypothetical protein Nepgr_029185 [Nepenthes gracilis]